MMFQMFNAILIFYSVVFVILLVTSFIGLLKGWKYMDIMIIACIFLLYVSISSMVKIEKQKTELLHQENLLNSMLEKYDTLNNELLKQVIINMENKNNK